MVVENNIDYFRTLYFTFDLPVPYTLKCGYTLEIAPVKLADSMIFLTSYGVLDIDKNLSNDVEVIQMSYLKFLDKCILPLNDQTKQQLINICLLCLGFTLPIIRYDEKGRAILSNADLDYKELFYITAKEFDEIKRIILYQNLPKYDDEYIDPELKANMEEMDRIRGQNLQPPSLERRMAIITSHCGITKDVQMNMTLRSHSILFEEVAGEVEYSAVKGISCYGGNPDEVQWIYKKAKNKFEDYITSKEKYNKSMGGNGHIASTTNSSEGYSSQYNKFIGG